MITDRQIRLVIGSLLHDIGKVVYRSGDGRNHSQSGYGYLRDEAGIQDEEILNCVRYHHGSYIKNAQIPVKSSAYVTYYADNVASFSDRREAEDSEDGFDKKTPLDSVFNILNGNHGKSHYAMQVLDLKSGINYPTETATSLDEYFYKKVIQNITDNLKGITITEEYLNSLLSVLEANLSYIPSSTSRRELADISLYDHMKMTAAIASCVEQYLEEKGENDYRGCLFTNATKTYEDQMFLLYSIDISGIQSFIYTIGEQGALRGLRARSFYLELMMEHIVDELLEKLSLSRANLIYTGGGHCYMLVPNTARAKTVIDASEKELNQWMMKHFGMALYVAGGYVEASANNFRNLPEGSYSELYLEVSRKISLKKNHRYNADEIHWLNSRTHDGERECKVCRQIAHLKEDKCPTCNALEKMSGNILYKNFFSVLCEPEENALPLPWGRYLVADADETALKKRMEKDAYVRSYTKNNIYTGKHVSTKLWVGDHTTGDTFEAFAEKAEGVKRIAILRADVDNLGNTFVRGFEQANGNTKYVTLSRTATLSRQLSLFFKCYINHILDHGTDTAFGKNGQRNVTIVYSGGDDVFLAGSWNEVIAAFMELKAALERFTLGTLTISGGIGVYHAKYPLNIMAKEVEVLEDASKHVQGKNAITIFDETHSYPWKEFLTKVVDEKFCSVRDYFDATTDHGMAFLYHLTELLRNTGEKINIARYVYLLSRMEPDEKADPSVRERYRAFSRNMYQWSRTEKDRRELITAIYLYVYLQREREEKE